MAARAHDPWDRGFSTSFRGFDQSEVREHLRDLWGQLQEARDRIAELESQLHARGSSDASLSLAELDDAAVAERLGDEAARVLRTAHEAAAEMRAKAAEHMSRSMREVQDEASRLRTEADVEAARRREAASVDAAAEVERAKAEGRRMIGEAQAVRERMMADLSRRRDVGRRQLAQLADGRDRLLSAYEQVRRSLDEITSELASSVPEAERLAGDALNRPLAGDEELMASTMGTRRPMPVISSAPAIEVAVEHHETHIEPRVETEDSVESSTEDSVAIATATDTADSDDVGADNDTADATEPTWADDQPAAEIGSDPVADAVPAEDVVDITTVPDSTEVPDAPSDMPEFASIAPDAEPEPDVPPTRVEPAVVIDLTDRHAASAAGSVDDLFARIRAARSESVAHAVEVLAAEVPASSAPASPAASSSSLADGSDAGVAAASVEEAVSAEGDVQTMTSSPFDARRAALELTERSLARHLKRVLADEQNEVLERLRQARSMPNLEELVGDLAEHAERYRAAAADDLRAAAIAGARSCGADGSAAERLGTHAKVRDGVLAEVGMELTGLIRDRIGRCLDEGQGDPDEAAHQLRAAYREMKVQRLDALASHFAVSAYARGAFAAIPADAKVCWMVDPDGPECADAEDNHLAGALDHGASFPTGHVQPPAHLGCRCHVVVAD